MKMKSESGGLNPGEFRNRIYRFYRKNRRDLPWRNTNDPYRILVSEMMLQQTQVKRVLEIYPGFIEKFPDFAALYAAPVKDLLSGWQGLGYNRRALALKKTASRIIDEWNGILPDDEKTLCSLPGIGKATAAAVQAFAFKKPSLLIETNIRRVFIHCYFLDRPLVSDREILPLIKETLDHENPRDWYYALMDYGSYLGKTRENPNRRSRQYRKQSPFEGSNRQVRGRILSYLITNGNTLKTELCEELDLPSCRINPVVDSLIAEGFIIPDGDFVKIS
jgi:A/G-specific adenine glycosylase